MKNIKGQRGFTFVELAIVMVIIGLLIVSILAGSSIIRSAKVRSVVTDATNFQSTFDLFVTKFGAMPGDISDITSSLTAGSYPLTNGNGDNQITWSSGEGAQAWYQMALAGMLTTGLTGVINGSADAVVGTNIPGAKITSAGYAIDYDASTTGTSNHLHFAVQSAAGAGINNNVVLSPIDAKNVDSKVDDGIPNTGRVQDPSLAMPCSTGATPDSYNIGAGDAVDCMLNIQLDSGS